ncbi:MAG: TRAP transporter substrate-binding protein DctP [Oscillibacter sp.]|nr:TRAP transporter substrate-binding protein DctP [Oscillibacter sp.]
MRKRQIIFYFGIGVFLVLSVLIVGSYIVSEHIKKESPGSGDSQSTHDEYADAIVLKMASPYTSGSFQSQILEKFCDFCNQNLGPEIYIQLYENGSLGNERQLLDALKNQRLELCAISSANISYLEESAAIPFMMPFNVRNLDDTLALLGSDAAQEIYRKLERQNIYNLGYFYNGLRYIWSTKPIYNLEDLHTVNLCVSPVDSYIRAFDGIVNSTIDTAVDNVLPNLKIGAIDTYDLSLTEVMQTELYKYTPYCLKLRHSYSATSILVNQHTRDLLTEEQYGTLVSSMEAVSIYAQMLYGSLSNAWEREFAKIGIEFSELPPQDLSVVTSQMQQQFLEYFESL